MILILLTDLKPFEFFPECIVQAFDESEDICPQLLQLIPLKESVNNTIKHKKFIRGSLLKS